MSALKDNEDIVEPLSERILVEYLYMCMTQFQKS